MTTRARATAIKWLVAFVRVFALAVAGSVLGLMCGSVDLCKFGGALGGLFGGFLVAQEWDMC